MECHRIVAQMKQKNMYIFVKLTDSALRAIEEYQRNDYAKRFNGGTEQSAKIQFSGNNGFIHFPLPDSTKGRKFGFAIDDIEGSLECIHQSQQELDVLGALSYRMRIHANDDVYDTTRTKMAIAEETEKSKCIREIKPNQTDIGRKVKKAVSAATVAATINQNFNNNNNNNNNNNVNNINNHHLSTTNNALGSQSHSNNNSSNSYISSRNKLSTTTTTGGIVNRSPTNAIAASRSPNAISATFVNNNNNNNNNGHGNGLTNQQHFSSAVSTLSSQLASGISNGYAEMKTNNNNNNNNGMSKKQNNIVGGGNKGNSKSVNVGGIQKGNGNKQLPDISRRKIRERLIQLLALKPFKKPELYTRLKNEGLRDRERPLINNILKDISSLSRDNTFNLKRQMWNDVNENWPYYTEQEIQQLKRRKPQNLTPPLSSDAGSSTSGHSPTSIHTVSPPPLVAGVNSMAMSNAKRNAAESAAGSTGVGVYDEDFFSGKPAKRQRISHYQKDPGPGVKAAANQRFTTNTNRQTASTTTDYLSTGGGGGIGVGGRQNNKNHMQSPNTFAATQDNTKTSDLSFNVLDNVDELMPHMQDSNFFNNGTGAVVGAPTTQRKHLNSNTNFKEKQNNKNNSNTNTNNNKQRHNYSNNTTTTTTTTAAISPKPYGSSFVPESRKTNNSPQSKKQQQNRLSPNVAAKNVINQPPPPPPQQQQKLYTSPNKQMNTTTIDDNNLMRSQSPNNQNNYKISKNRYQSQQQPQQQPQLTNNKNVRQSQKQQQQLQQQSQSQQHQPQQELITISTYQQQQPPPLQQQQQQQQPQLSTPPQQTHNFSSPTQQIAAAASNYATTSLNDSTTQRQKYDFSQYTAITSIEQRRKYKTEFEADYDEYLKLLAQIESVGKRFRALADQLENAHKGCADYYEIRQKILMEYEHIRNEDSLKHDKERFDYLHEKLAHIKQLVTDYDKTLTDAAAAAAAAAELQQLHQQQEHLRQQQQLQMQQHQQQQQQQQQQRLSPMIMSEGESNPSPPMNYHTAMLMQQQKYHAAETISYQNQQQQQQQQSQKSTSRISPNLNASYVILNQQQQQPEVQQGIMKNDANDNSDSDSSSASDNYDDDDDDDDDDQSHDDGNSNSNDDD